MTFKVKIMNVEDKKDIVKCIITTTKSTITTK